MKWREVLKDTEWKCGKDCGNRKAGGIVWLSADDMWAWSAWTKDASSMNDSDYKTLKAAQRAVERWLEKHG